MRWTEERLHAKRSHTCEKPSMHWRPLKRREREKQSTPSQIDAAKSPIRRGATPALALASTLSHGRPCCRTSSTSGRTYTLGSRKTRCRYQSARENSAREGGRDGLV